MIFWHSTHDYKITQNVTIYSKLFCSKNKKHERPRKPTTYHGGHQNETDDASSEDILDENDEEVSNVYRKISERREELNRARRNGDDCHVS